MAVVTLNRRQRDNAWRAAMRVEVAHVMRERNALDRPFKAARALGRPVALTSGRPRPTRGTVMIDSPACSAIRFNAIGGRPGFGMFWGGSVHA